MSKSFRIAGVAGLLLTMGLSGGIAAPPQAAPVQHKHLMVVVRKLLPGITLFDLDTKLIKQFPAPNTPDGLFFGTVQ